MRRTYATAAGLAVVTGLVIAVDATLGLPGGVLGGRLLDASAHASRAAAVSELPPTPDAAPTGATPTPSLTAAPASGPLAPASGVTAPDPAVLADLLDDALADPALGNQLSASVVDQVTGDQLYGTAAGRARTPASTTKLLTAAATLERLGAQARIKTVVVQTPTTGATPTETPTLTLVGGGDPSLRVRPGGGDPSLRSLAKQTANVLAGQDIDAVRLRYDASLFAPPEESPTWPETYVTSGVVSPVAALSVGDARVPDPAREAGVAFALELERAGVAVRAAVLEKDASPADEEVASVLSRPVGVLVQNMLTDSDNDYAEAFGHLVAVAALEPATFEGGAAATIDAVASLGVSTDGVRLYDGSGLSRDNRIPSSTLTELLIAAAAAGNPELAPLLAGLPVAAFSGSLAERFLLRPESAGAGVVRAKTGTLTGISALAGTVQDRAGRVLVFAFVADDVPDVLGARQAMDRAAAVLARCGCR